MGLVVEPLWDHRVPLSEFIAKCDKFLTFCFSLAEIMSVRPRTITQENGGFQDADLQACEKQYYEMPYAHCSLERKRDLTIMTSGGSRFPLKNCLGVVALCLFITAFLMPFLALRKLPPERKDIIWWRSGVVYHVYVRSFYDSNGDGVGDLRGTHLFN